MKTLAAAALLLALAAVPAHAVVGGKRVNVAEVPWFADIDGCGGTLIAPDRLVTAAHCVRRSAPQDSLDRIEIAGERRRGLRFALHPSWRQGDIDDVALIQLDAPVTTVAPVPLGTAPVDQALVLGTGLASRNQRSAGPLREAALRAVTDRDCGLFYPSRPGRRFNAERMLCMTDIDGQRPLSSACNGDSGGPLIAGTHAAPVLLGVVSFGGGGCGADRLPTVFADVAYYAPFISNPQPVWAPVAAGPSQVSGRGRAGRRLTCTVPAWEGAPETVRLTWYRASRRGSVRRVGRGATYRVRRADRGRAIVCIAEASNAGGIASAPVERGSAVVIRR